MHFRNAGNASLCHGPPPRARACMHGTRHVAALAQPGRRRTCTAAACMHAHLAAARGPHDRAQLARLKKACGTGSAVLRCGTEPYRACPYAEGRQHAYVCAEMCRKGRGHSEAQQAQHVASHDMHAPPPPPTTPQVTPSSCPGLTSPPSLPPLPPLTRQARHLWAVLAGHHAAHVPARQRTHTHMHACGGWGVGTRCCVAGRLTCNHKVPCHAMPCMPRYCTPA